MSTEQNQPMLVAGPTSINIGVSPDGQDFMVLLAVEDADYGDVNVSLGIASDLTEIIAGMLRCQNMLTEAEDLCQREGYTDVSSRLGALATVTARYPQVDDYPIVDD